MCVCMCKYGGGGGGREQYLEKIVEINGKKTEVFLFKTESKNLQKEG